jgi:hypothetical protein
MIHLGSLIVQSNTGCFPVLIIKIHFRVNKFKKRENTAILDEFPADFEQRGQLYVF